MCLERMGGKAETLVPGEGLRLYKYIISFSSLLSYAHAEHLDLLYAYTA